MTTPTTSLGLSHIQTEFGGSAPTQLSEYYRGGANVPSDTATSATDGTPISTSGLIRSGMFRGVTKITDNIPWTYRSTLSATSWGANTGNGIAWNGSVFCAVGFAGVCATSSDNGATWTYQSGLSSTLYINEFDVDYGNEIAWNGSVFCVVTSRGRAATSPDGVTWTLQPSFNTAWGGTPSFSAGTIIWNGSVFIAGGAGGRVVTSPDGVTWTSRTFVLNVAGWGSSDSVLSAVWNGVANSACIVGSAGACATTTDNGATWTYQSGLVAALGLFPAWSIAWSGSVFCVIGGTGGVPTRCATSPDGVTWTLQSLTSVWPGNNVSFCIGWNGSVFLAFKSTGTPVVASSPDGVTWTARPNLGNTAWGTNTAVKGFARNTSTGTVCVIGDFGACATSP